MTTEPQNSIPERQYYMDENVNVRGTAGNDIVHIYTEEASFSGRPYDVIARLGEGNDVITLDARRPVRASLNGGPGNDFFAVYIGDGNPNSVVNINGDGGHDVLHVINPGHFKIQHDGKGRVTLIDRKGSRINLTGIETIEINTSYHGQAFPHYQIGLGQILYDSGMGEPIPADTPRDLMQQVRSAPFVSGRG